MTIFPKIVIHFCNVIGHNLESMLTFLQRRTNTTNTDEWFFSPEYFYYLEMWLGYHRSIVRSCIIKCLRPQLRQEMDAYNLAEKTVTNAESQLPSDHLTKMSTTHISTPLQWSLEVRQKHYPIKYSPIFWKIILKDWG